MKKLTATALLILTICILVISFLVHPLVGKTDNGVKPALSGDKGGEAAGWDNISSQEDILPENGIKEPMQMGNNLLTRLSLGGYRDFINSVPQRDLVMAVHIFCITYMLLASILSIMCIKDNAKKQIHTDEDFKNQTEELVKIKAQLEESTEENEKLKTDLEANKVDSEKITELQKNLDETQKIVSDSKNHLESREAELAKAKAEAESLTGRAENLEKDNKGIRREVDKLKSLVKATTSEKEEVISQLVELKKQLEKQSEELKSAKANVKGGKEAIPPAAYQILYLLQKEGRLIDILNENVSEVDDEALGGAIRPVLEGCAKLLKDRLIVEPVLKDDEGSVITLDEADPEIIKLSGNVPPKGPYKGELIHHGWRLKECHLPELVDGWKGNVIAPAEVEIS